MDRLDSKLNICEHWTFCHCEAKTNNEKIIKHLKLLKRVFSSYICLTLTVSWTYEFHKLPVQSYIIRSTQQSFKGEDVQKWHLFKKKKKKKENKTTMLTSTLSTQM